MRLYRQLADFKAPDRGLAIAIGNFDGFHKGHRAVIDSMLATAKAQNLYSAVMIFEPQPLEYFGQAIPSRLFTLRDKIKHFKQVGIDIVICISFKKTFAALDAHSFVSDILHQQLKVKSVTVGSEFNFGCGGSYGIEELKVEAAKLGIEAKAISGIAADNTRVSSTMIRALIENGDFTHAKSMLGHDYALNGRVIHGNEIGRTIGFPTANVNLNRKVCPLKGVYAVKIRLKDQLYNGVANVGRRPTIDKNLKTLLEVHIFDFKGDLYGQAIEIIFKAKIRDEQKFPNLDSLMAQIKADKDQALEILVNS